MAVVKIAISGLKLRPVNAVMSSTVSGGYDATNCIDGIISMDEGEARNICHTSEEPFPWLTIDFGARVQIKTVLIINRNRWDDRTQKIWVSVASGRALNKISW